MSILDSESINGYVLIHDARALDKAIIAYQSRDRRFGGVK